MSIEAADRIISEGKADFVSMCRPLIADPEMPRKYATGREKEHRPCLRCKWCSRRLITPRVIGCAVNPMIAGVMECPDGKVPPAREKKRVGVVGGGPAGIQAALTLSERGHDVTLYEKSNRLGGQCVPGAAAPFKAEMRDYLAWLEYMANKSGAKICLNTTATKELLEKEKYDALVIANGAKPFIPAGIPGIDRDNVCWAPDVELGKHDCGEKVLIVGLGTVGAECAVHLGMKGKKVVAIEMASNDRCMHFSGVMRLEFNSKMDQYGVDRRFGCKLKEIADCGAIYTDLSTGEDVFVEADTVLLAMGLRPNTEEADELRRCAPETEVYLVGDVQNVATIAEAVNSAFRVALNI